MWNERWFSGNIVGMEIRGRRTGVKIFLARCDIVHVLNFLVGNYSVNINNWKFSFD